MISFDCRQPAKASSDKHADPFGITFVDNKSGVHHGKMGSCQSVLYEKIHLFDFFFVDEILRIESPNLTCYPYRHVGGIKTGNQVDTGFPRHQGIPVFLVTDTKWRHDSNPGHNNSSHDAALL